MLKAAIPLLRVRSSREGLDFYLDGLGFEARSTYKPDAASDDPAYHVMVRDDATIHVSSFSADGVAGGATTIVHARRPTTSAFDSKLTLRAQRPCARFWTLSGDKLVFLACSARPDSRLR